MADPNKYIVDQMTTMHFDLIIASLELSMYPHGKDGKSSQVKGSMGNRFLTSASVTPIPDTRRVMDKSMEIYFKDPLQSSFHLHLKLFLMVF